MTVTLLLVMGACVPIFGIGAKFALTNAHVDSTFSCPNPSTDFAYDVHVTIDANNSTSSSVIIESISETWKSVAIHGSWDGVLGAHGTTAVNTYSPRSVPSGGSATIRFVVGFVCHNSGPKTETYGDFAFSFSLVTSAGTYKLDSVNKHRLITPG